jgi:4-oxalomesaconate tautomerase
MATAALPVTPQAQTRIPCVLMRGGTSKGAYFWADDLPPAGPLRDAVILRAFGSPDARQVDGIGGADSLTSKVAILSPPTRADAQVDYLFGQVVVNEARVDYGQNCGNILAGVGPFALAHGLVPVAGDVTEVAIHMVNTAQLARARVATPNGLLDYEGDARIDGVPGTAAGQSIEFCDTAGSTCGALLPTGRVRDEIDGIAVTLIDNGMPVVLVRAQDLGCTGHESPEAMEADTALKARVETLRLKAGPLMNLGDVSKRTVPKMVLIAAPSAGGALSTRSFIPHKVHTSIGVLGAVSVATGAALPGSVCDGLAVLPTQATAAKRLTLSIEHPTGEFTVVLERDTPDAPPTAWRASLLRTARWLFDGFVHVPRSVWQGRA